MLPECCNLSKSILNSCSTDNGILLASKYPDGTERSQDKSNPVISVAKRAHYFLPSGVVQTYPTNIWFCWLSRAASHHDEHLPLASDTSHLIALSLPTSPHSCCLKYLSILHPLLLNPPPNHKSRFPPAHQPYSWQWSQLTLLVLLSCTLECSLSSRAAAHDVWCHNARLSAWSLITSSPVLSSGKKVFNGFSITPF